MGRFWAAGAACLIDSAYLWAQSGGAPNHTNGNTTRTQTIHVGEPPTNHPGGNPGRTTGKTGNQTPFGPPSPYGPPTPPPGSCDANPPSPPKQILTFPVTNTGGTAAVGAWSLRIALNAKTRAEKRASPSRARGCDKTRGKQLP